MGYIIPLPRNTVFGTRNSLAQANSTVQEILELVDIGGAKLKKRCPLLVQ